MITDIEKTMTGGDEPAQAGTTNGIQRINLGLLHASPTNPRKHFDAEKLAELADSIEEHGVMMPVLARPSKLEAGKFEIVAGERRFRASTLLVTRLPEHMELAGEDAELLAKLEALHAARIELPVIVEELDDGTVLELQMIENLQRADLTALEEARGYEALLALPGYTPAKIAQKIGRSVNTVLYKLKMLQAPESLRKALEEGKVGERHLVVVARVPGEKAREEVAKRILQGEYDYDSDSDEPLSVRHTLNIITRDYCATLKGVPWKLEDAELLPEAGACVTCPHFARFAAEQDSDLAAELGNGRGQTDPLTCLNPGCAKKKHDAIFKLKKQEAKGGTVTVLKPEEAAKIIGDYGNLRTTNVVKLDDRPGHDQTGHWDNDKLPTWRELLEDRLPAGALQVANVKAVGVVELVDVKTAVEAARGHKKHGKVFAKTVGKKVMTEAEKKAKEKENLANKVAARAKVCLMEYLRERAAEKGMDRDASLAVLDTVLREAGKDGCQLMAEVLAIAPREKRKNEYGVVADAYREPILAALRAQDAGKPEIDALIMLGVISKYVKCWGAKFDSLTPLQEHFGFDEKTILTLATTEVKAELEAKAAKKKPARQATKSSTDPVTFSVAAEASKTAAADKRAKSKERRAESDGFDSPLMKAGRQGISVGKPGPEWLEVFDGDKGPGMMGRGPRGKSANAEDYAEAAKKAAPAKMVKDLAALVEDWNQAGAFVRREADYFHCDTCGGVCAVGADLVADVAELPEGEFECEDCSDGRPKFGVIFPLVANQEAFELWVPKKAKPAVKKAG